MKRQIRHIILIVLLFASSDIACGQSDPTRKNCDLLTLEAIIHDHNKVGAALIARSAIEEVNESLHKATKETAIEYKDINVKLDQYTRCFDAIDLVLQGTATAYSLHRTVKAIGEKVGQYKSLMDDYASKCLARGNIVSSDTLILGIGRRTLGRLSEDADGLKTSFTALLAMYGVGAAAGAATGTPPASRTVQMIAILRDIGDCLDDVRISLDVAYRELWKYIRIRTTFWKAEVYQAKSMGQIANEAFDRWMNASSRKRK